MRGMILHELGLIELDEGELGPARAHLDLALPAIPDQAEDHDAVLCELMRLAAAEGDAAAMQDFHDRALARIPRPLDPRDRRVQWLLFGHARALHALGRTAEAIAPLEQLQAAAAAAGAALEGAEFSLLLGELRHALGDLDAAARDLHHALTELQRVAPPRSLTLAAADLELGRLALTRRRFDEAAEFLAPAVAIYTAVAEPDHTPLARARFAHAQALTGDATRAPAAARTLAAAALAALRAKSRHPEADLVAAWLAAHP